MTPTLSVVPPPRSTPVVDNAVIGTIIFIVTETMMFAGLISGLAIVKAGAIGPWPPPDQPRLPIEATAFNTLVLLVSGAVLFHAALQPYFAARRCVLDRVRQQIDDRLAEEITIDVNG